MAQDKNEQDELPTEAQRAELGAMIAFAFVEIRRLGWEGKAAQSADLADAFHNLPREMYGNDRFSWRITRGMLKGYEDKWVGQTTFRYTDLLDKIRLLA